MSGAHWRLIPASFHPAEGHMEWDRRSFHSFREGDAPILRFFQFDRTTFTLGRLESRRMDLSRLLHPYEVRPTGGWTVLHGPQDLCYSITAPVRDPLVGGDLISSYQKISRLLQGAFQALGREVELSQAPHRAAGMAHCFAAPSKCELTLSGKKVSGGAQAREGNVFLQQGAVLLRVSSEWRKAFPERDLSAMTGLNEGPGLAPVGARQLEEAVAAAFARAGAGLEMDLTPSAGSPKLSA